MRQFEQDRLLRRFQPEVLPIVGNSIKQSKIQELEYDL